MEVEQLELVQEPLTLPPPPPTRLDSLVQPTEEHDEFDVSWNDLLDGPGTAHVAARASPQVEPAPTPLQSLQELELLAPKVESDLEDEESTAPPPPLDSLPNLPPMRLTWQHADSDLASAFPSSALTEPQRPVAQIVTEYEALAPETTDTPPTQEEEEEEEEEEPPPPPSPHPPPVQVARGPRRRGGGKPPDA